MKKLLGIVVLCLLFVNTAKAEVVLRCILDPEFNNQRITVEIDLKKNIFRLDGRVFNIKTIKDKFIEAENNKKTFLIKIDRFDGFIDINHSGQNHQGSCTKYNRIF